MKSRFFYYATDSKERYAVKKQSLNLHAYNMPHPTLIQGIGSSTRQYRQILFNSSLLFVTELLSFNSSS